ncbi:MAG TPA: cyclic nucleotide-binding domain-containing protein [Nitrospirae bacterium]|nr:cyclic nucleotide-binding domain-containing protein [Nitrospirota bacterium]
MINIADLKKQILLKELDDEELLMIREKITVGSYPKGTLIFKEGAPIKGIHLVKDGKVEISKSTPDGWKQTLAILNEGHFFGELSVIEDKKAHGANVSAVENTELFLLKTETFKSLEDSHPQVMYKIVKAIARVASKNIHSMNEKLVNLLISY